MTKAISKRIHLLHLTVGGVSSLKDLDGESMTIMVQTLVASSHRFRAIAERLYLIHTLEAEEEGGT